MKKTILFMLLMVNIATAEELNGIMGIQFGSSKATVKAQFMAKQPEATIYTDKPKTLTFQDTKFGGRKSLGIIFAFTDDDKLHTIIVLIDPEFESKAFSLYDEINQEINEKYHTYDKQWEDYTYPYDKSDRYSHGVTALKIGKLDVATTWNFPDSTGEDNVIQTTITSNISVKITYQNGYLINQVVSKNKEKNSADY